MSIMYPITDKGLWHNGLHKNGQGDVKNILAGELVAYKTSGGMIYPDTVPEEITPDDYEALNEEIAKECTKGKFDVLWELPQLTDERKRELMRIIGLQSSGDLVLLRHEILMGNGKKQTKTISFFSLYMHLNSVKVTESSVKSSALQFWKAKTPIYMPPGSILGKYGNAEIENDIFQLEYFAKASFKLDIEHNNSQKYLVIPKDSLLYSITESAIKVSRKITVDTIFEVTENADPETHPNTMKVRVQKYPATIDIEEAKKLLKEKASTEEEKKKADALKIADFVTEKGYKIPVGFANGLESIPIKASYEGADSSYTEQPGMFEMRNTSKREEVYVCKDLVGLGEKWVKTDSKVFKELHAKNVIRLKATGSLETYDSDPCIVNAVVRNDKTSREIRIMYREASVCTGIMDSVRPEKGKRDGNGNIYYTYEGDAYVQVPKAFNSDYGELEKYITVFKNSDLKDFSNCKTPKEIRDFFLNLYKGKGFEITKAGDNETLVEFLERTKEVSQSCAYEHSTEWSQKRTIPPYFTYLTQYRELFKKMAIWESNGKNKNLPKDIQNGELLTYFYPETFEAYIRKIHDGFAFDLMLVQDMVMNIWCLKKGNLGMYPDSWGKTDGVYNIPSDDQTYCNHAVFLTIQAVDANYCNYTGTSLNKFPDPPYPKAYDYKPSNYWCDVLNAQSKKTASSGIVEITAEQAQNYANWGYVVIGAWKNLIKKDENLNASHSPHFVTVRPLVNSADNTGVFVANVGWTNGVDKYKNIFSSDGNEVGKKKWEEVRWYCNVKQAFRYDPAEIIRIAKLSGWQ